MAMSANVAATATISGLTASTAYKIYFVAKDTANNVQAAVQGVAVTTTATPDLTAPTTSAGPSVSGTTDTGTTLSVTINEHGTGYYLVQAAATATPSVAAVQAGTSLAMAANVAATASISGLTASTAYKTYFVAKDAANNVQATVQSVAFTTAAAPDPMPTGAALADVTRSDEGGGSSIIPINAGGATDSLGRGITYSMSSVLPTSDPRCGHYPLGLTIDSTTGVISGVHDSWPVGCTAGGVADGWPNEVFTVTVTATPAGGTHPLVRAFTLTIRDDG